MTTRAAMAERPGPITSIAWILVVAVTVGVGLGALTKAVLVLFEGVIHVLWVSLPDGLGIDPSSVGVRAADGLPAAIVPVGCRLACCRCSMGPRRLTAPHPVAAR